jgi:hypothetical protein
VLRHLSTVGISIDIRTRHGDTALQRAAFYGQMGVVQALVALNADVNAADQVPRSGSLMTARPEVSPLRGARRTATLRCTWRCSRVTLTSLSSFCSAWARWISATAWVSRHSVRFARPPARRTQDAPPLS